MLLQTPPFSHARRHIFKDKDQLELIAQSEEDEENWKASLLRAGVYPTQEAKEESDEPVRLRSTAVVWFPFHSSCVSLPGSRDVH